MGGNDWAPHGLTMVGNLRIQNVRYAIEQVVADGIPGDFVELGVWRGGVCLFARGALNVLGQSDRDVIAFDAFESIQSYETNAGFLTVHMEQVQATFERFGLAGDNVKMIKGMFKDTLPHFKASRDSKPIAVLRLDSNFYDGTTGALYDLYELVPVGGFVVSSCVLSPIFPSQTPFF